MEIIDVHVHTLACGTMCSGRIDVRFEVVRSGLEKRGITKGILVPINDIAYQPVDEMNDYMIEVTAKNPNFVGFIDIEISKAHYYQGIKKIEDDIIKRYESGLKGIKVHLQNLGVNADDWRLLPIYRLAGELNIPIMIHCHPGSAPGVIENSNPRHIEKMIRAFHKTEFIISHFGGILYFPYMEWLSHDNVHFESSGVIKSLKEYYGIDKIKYVLDSIGYDKIFFGSDFPSIEIDSQIEIMKDIVPDEYHKQVFSGNVETFGKKFSWWK